MENNNNTDFAKERTTLAASFVRFALPSSQMSQSDGGWLPSPSSEEDFDRWVARAAGDLERVAKSFRAQGGRWRVGLAAKAVGQAAVAGVCGYALTASLFWRLHKNGDYLDMEKPIERALWPWELWSSLSMERKLGQATDKAIADPGAAPPSWREIVAEKNSSALKEFSSAAAAFALGILAAPVGWVGLVIAQHPLRQRGLTLAAEELAAAARMMSSGGLGEFGGPETAIAGWARACRVAHGFGAKTGAPMLAALALRASSRPGKPLGVVPCAAAGWISSSMDDGEDGGAFAEDGTAREKLAAILGNGKSEEHLARSALFTHLSKQAASPGSKEAKDACASFAAWRRESEDRWANATRRGFMEKLLAIWLGSQNTNLISTHFKSKIFLSGDPEGEQAPRGAAWLRELAAPLRKIQDEQNWPPSMRLEASMELVRMAVFLEKPALSKDSSIEIEADEHVDAILRDVGSRLVAAGSPLDLSAEQMAKTVSEALAESPAWSKEIASGKNFSSWGWKDIMKNAEPIFMELRVQWEAEQIGGAAKPPMDAARKASRHRL